MASRRVRPTGGFELWWWYFMRLSGLLLIFLALGHLCIMHLIHNVEVINYAFIADRWTNPKSGVFWRLWDLSMINLAVLHGLNGLRQVLHEYVLRPARRVVIVTLVWGLAVMLMVIGNYAILRFETDSSYYSRFRAANPNLVESERERTSAPSPTLAKPEQARRVR